jgi:two-component system, chemotaxis family, CheB/CheR fusion protein
MTLDSRSPTDAAPPTDPEQRPAFGVVGIGASAGGLVAVQSLLGALPRETGMAFVVVLHLSPKHESKADHILQRSTRMSVVQVSENTKIEPNHVYVISPRMTLSMQDGCLCVRRGDRPKGPLIAIDLFFRTLADAHRDRAIGIVMSGTGSDGTAGIARVKEKGGVTIAQAPVDSEFEDMPRNAIASGHIDFVLAASEIPQKLIDIWTNAQAIALPKARDDEALDHKREDDRPDAESALHDILGILAARTGHDFSHYKRATVLRRLERRMQVNLVPDLPAYREFLRAEQRETKPLLADMLISVTNFFRDREAFDTLERVVIPRLVASREAGDTIRVWVAGCATGEEAYSLGMLLQDEINERGLDIRFQIFASDISASAIDIARVGAYPESIVTDIPPVRLRRYFTLEGGRYQVKRALREQILFAAHNVLHDPPFSRIDLISCRNLLIYLSRAMQERVLETFHYSLAPDGVLFLGSAESVETMDAAFNVIDKKYRIFRAMPGARRRAPMLPLRITDPIERPAASTEHPKFSPAALHQRILDRYASPSVVIDSEANLLHVSSEAGRYLRHAGGIPSHNLLTLIEPELRLELRGALFQATHSGQSVEARRVRLSREGRFVYVNMIVRPFSDPDAGMDFALVQFEEVDVAMGSEETSLDSSGKSDILLQMEQELQRMREQLHTTVEFSDASTDELKASNEELQAINEELRSTTEELETSTEELHSVNEELLTVNGELKSKVDEAERANDDLLNFIAASDIATIFVDSSLHILRYTPRVQDLFNIRISDVGRSLTDLTHRLDYSDLAEDVIRATRNGEAIEREINGMDSRTFVLRIQPYRSETQNTDGAVVTFIDITGLRRAERRLETQSKDMQAALQQSRDYAVLATDEEGRITGWNAGAARLFGYDEADILGEPVARLFVPEDVAAGVPQYELETARREGRAEDDRWHLRADGSRVFCTGVMMPLATRGVGGFVKIARDASRQQAALRITTRRLQKARAGRADAEAAIALKDEFLAVMSHELKHPLNLINVSAELIGRSRDIDFDRHPTSARALANIGRAVRAQSRIIDDLLDLSRIRTGKLALDMGPVDLVGLTRAVVDTAAADASSAELEIAFETAEDHVIVMGDSARLNQIVWNLISNAVKFTPAGGHIEVQVRILSTEACIEVTDDGVGIEPEFQPRIFEMFGQARARAASTKGGLGIGLALVRQLTEHHGGRIQCVSQGTGTGASFRVWLPLYDAEADLPAAAPLPKASGRCAGLHVLVVDDDRDTAHSLQMLLEIEGAKVDAATSGAEALSIAAKRRPDLVLTDVGMPEMDGYMLLELLRAQPGMGELPVIALTGFGRPHDVTRAQQAGFDAHISKPVEMEDLLAKIVEVTPPTARTRSST